MIGRPRGKETLPGKPRYRETPEVADATCRLIVSLGKRAETEDSDGLACLLSVEENLREVWRAAIAGLRDTGYTDREIGEQLGTTRQAVDLRWPREGTP
jgi:hypothetical protein